MANTVPINDRGGYVTATGSDSLSLVNGFGCNGKTAQTEVTVAAAATDAATTQALVNELRAALIANGICT